MNGLNYNCPVIYFCHNNLFSSINSPVSSPIYQIFKLSRVRSTSTICTSHCLRLNNKYITALGEYTADNIYTTTCMPSWRLGQLDVIVCVWFQPLTTALRIHLTVIIILSHHRPSSLEFKKYSRHFAPTCDISSKSDMFCRLHFIGLPFNTYSHLFNVMKWLNYITNSVGLATLIYISHTSRLSFYANNILGGLSVYLYADLALLFFYNFLVRDSRKRKLLLEIFLNSYTWDDASRSP